MINWKVRIKNKAFWTFIIPAMLLLIQAIAELFGYTIDLTMVGEKMINVVNALFVVLVGIGIVNDPTTKGITDSKNAMTYIAPKED